MLIDTEFDNPLEEDIIFEETEQTQDYAEMLKNTENMLKSYLYIKKIANAANPFINAVVNVETIDTHTEKTQYIFNIDNGKILIKNLDSTENWSFYFNDGEFVLFPFESIELPFFQDTKFETKGRFSLIESEYSLGKG